jgi:hypothetical protein
LVQWKHHPEACLDEVGKLTAEEEPMHGGGWVSAAFGIDDYFFGVPGGVVQPDRDAFVPQLL